MDLWKSFNSSSLSPDELLGYLNESTVEWNVAPFPSNLIAIDGTETGGSSSLLVIKNAGSGLRIGGYPFERFTPAIATLFAVAWVIFWWLRSWRDFKVLKKQQPPKPSIDDDDEATVSTATTRRGLPEDFMMEREFRQQLIAYYYAPGATDLQVLEHYTTSDGLIPSPEIEKVTELVREMYKVDLRLWGMEDAQRVTEEEKNDLRRMSDDILAEVRRIVYEWCDPNSGVRWDPTENMELGQILTFLQQELPEKRYDGFYQY